MSLEITEQNGDNSPRYKVVNFYSSDTNPITTINKYENLTNDSTTVNLNDLINRIISIVNEHLDDAQQCKTTFRKNPMQPALYQVLCEMKNKIAPNTQHLRSTNDQSSEQLTRINNMLIAEGISEQNSTKYLAFIRNPLDYTDYETKLSQIREIYKSELEKYENHCNGFCSHVVTLLREQSQIRPISEEEIQQIVSIIRKKFATIQLQLKQSICEAVMVLRSRFFDARRQRKNFSKLAIEMLNEYFYANLSNPYPSDEAKEELARRCGISVAQVCNWFGNKRIRYKRNLNKPQEEANMYAAKIASKAARHNRNHTSTDY